VRAGARYVRYSPEVETREPDEDRTIEAIIASMRREGEVTERRYGHAVRTSHAKAHGLARGTLDVLPDLSPELAQGLFAEPRAYPVIVRLSHVPGELLDDRKVSCPRGLALKVLGVSGEMLPGHEGEATQDFALDTGKVFPSPDARAFLATIRALEAATPAPEALKAAVSFGSRALNAALHALGADSANLDFFGHEPRHPLAEAYYSQVPMRYGDHVAKLAVIPVTPALAAKAGERLDVKGHENALRMTVTGYLRENAAEFEVAVQLATDLDRMPVENANAEWPEGESPYRTVARLSLPPQDAYSRARTEYVEEALSFCPGHSLAAHRLLGGIGRARLVAYEAMSAHRRRRNGRPVKEPRSIGEMPD